VVVEGALHVLVGGVEADRMAALDHVDPGFVLGEGDVEDARGGRGFGQGCVVAAGAADDRAAGATAARGEQVAVAFAIEKRRPGQAADQAVAAVAAVEAVGAGAGLEQVVLGAGFDDVVAEAAGDADALDRGKRAFHLEPVVAGAEVGHQPARRAAGRADDLLRVSAGPAASRADRDPPGGADPEGLRFGVEGNRGEDVGAAATDDLQPTATAL